MEFLFLEIVQNYLGISIRADRNISSNDVTFHFDPSMERWLNAWPVIPALLKTADSLVAEFSQKYAGDNLAIKELLPLSMSMQYLGDNQSEWLDFFELIRPISIQTYESESSNMSFLIIQGNATDHLNNLGIDYIPCKNLSLRDALNDKQALKLIDAQSVALVLNKSYQLLGMAKKRKQSQSIHASVMVYTKSKEVSELKVAGVSRLVDPLVLRQQKDVQEEFRRIREDYVRINAEMTKVFEDIAGTLGLNTSSLEEIALYTQTNPAAKLSSQQLEEMQTHLSKLTPIAEDLRDNINIKESKIMGEYRENLENYVADQKKMWSEYMENFRKAEDFKYVFIRERQIHWMRRWIVDDIVFYNGTWQMRNFILLKSAVAGYLFDQQKPSTVSGAMKKVNAVVPQILSLYYAVKELSDCRVGALIIILEKTETHKDKVFKKLLRNERLSSQQFSGIIKTPRGNPMSFNMIDHYLLRLIASVDGALILDHQCKILSFGEMIKSEDLTGCARLTGARSQAAMAGSRFGLAIKISEDGDITIFHKEIQIARI